MATLAAMLKSKGFDVRGSDQNVYPPMSDFLREQGITTMEGYRAEHISAELDLVVVGNAISRGNPELEEVLDRAAVVEAPARVRPAWWRRRWLLAAVAAALVVALAIPGGLLLFGGDGGHLGRAWVPARQPDRLAAADDLDAGDLTRAGGQHVLAVAGGVDERLGQGLHRQRRERLVDAG